VGWRKRDSIIALSYCRRRIIALSSSRYRTVVIALSHCRHRIIKLSHYRTVAIALSHCRHRTIALSSSHYRTVALWIIKYNHGGYKGIPYFLTEKKKSLTTKSETLTATVT
jgi:hypothetical protein